MFVPESIVPALPDKAKVTPMPLTLNPKPDGVDGNVTLDIET